MTRPSVRKALYLASIVLYLLHQDWWQWDDPRTVLRLPIGLSYHVAYCLLASALLALLVRFAWPLARPAARQGSGDR